MNGPRLRVRQPSLDLPLNPDLDLLNQCQQAGVDICQSCRNGNCERCFCELLEGQVTLRSGDVISAPCTIALCTCSASTSVTLGALPTIPATEYWACQLLAPQTLLLPAGRQQPPQTAEQLVLLRATDVTPLSVGQINGRQMHIDRSIQGNGGYLLRFTARQKGPFTLFRSMADREIVVWPNISASLAAQCQKLARNANWPGRYFWRK